MSGVINVLGFVSRTRTWNARASGRSFRPRVVSTWLGFETPAGPLLDLYPMHWHPLPSGYLVVFVIVLFIFLKFFTFFYRRIFIDVDSTTPFSPHFLGLFRLGFSLFDSHGSLSWLIFIGLSLALVVDSPNSRPAAAITKFILTIKSSQTTWFDILLFILIFHFFSLFVKIDFTSTRIEFQQWIGLISWRFIFFWLVCVCTK